MSEPDFDPFLAFRVLFRNGVSFVVIGGYAASVLGSPVVTGDLDICYARDADNLERLAAALRELGARLRGPGVPDDLPFQLDARTLQLGNSFAFTTSGGRLDALATPSGTAGFRDLEAGAVTVTIDDMTVRVANLDDLIRMKVASDRTKDREHLEWLRALRQETSDPD